MIPPQAALPQEWPLPLPGGDLLWPAANGRLLREDGSTFLDLSAVGRYLPARPVPADRAGTRLAISWEWMDSETSLLLLTSKDGSLFRELEAHSLTIGAGCDTGFIGSVLVDDRFLYAAIRGRVGTAHPAWIDVEGGRVHPFYDPFAEIGFLSGSLRVVAVQKGPFARLVGTESCLNIRGEPSTFATVLGCVADGVLLRIPGNRDVPAMGPGGRREPLDGFIEVITPDGTSGFAHVGYLS